MVDGITFCTRNPLRMLENLDELKEKYNMFWFGIKIDFGHESVEMIE